MDDRVGTSGKCPGNLFCGLDILPLNYFSEFQQLKICGTALALLIGIFQEKINGSYKCLYSSYDMSSWEVLLSK